MAVPTESQLNAATLTPARHPLDPLTPEEIAEAAAILKTQRDLGARVRFETIVLQEPAKETVLNFRTGDLIHREAFIVILDNDAGATYEAVISLDQGNVSSWQHIPGVQPRIMFDEFGDCEAAVKANPEFQAAIKKRGITNSDLVMVDPWSAGNYGFEEEKGRRLVLARSFLRSSPTDNGYARPIEGVTAVVDLNSMEVVRVDDYGVVPLPPSPGNYASEFVGEFRKDLKPLEIAQPEGTSIQVVGYGVTWQKWHLRIGFTPREGLVIHNIGYNDQGRVRPIVYRASLSDMVVPYGDPSKDHYRKNAFDAGEYGIGTLANSLTLGCDCLGEIHYLDAVMNDGRGGVVTIPNAVCLHEEDYGILWKHTDVGADHSEIRRSRRLVVSSFFTIGNYDYGLFWYLYLDGTIEFEAKLTGTLYLRAIHEGEETQYGALVAPGVNGMIHEHYFNIRLDMSVDGDDNTVVEVEAKRIPTGPENPYGNAHTPVETIINSEIDAARDIAPQNGRFWKIINRSRTNTLGWHAGYKLMPGPNIKPMHQPDSPFMRRAGFVNHDLWVTAYDPDQLHAPGQYVSQNEGGPGLPEWILENRPLVDTDVVLWHTIGVLHLPRPEDFPVMPVEYVGFTLKPVGFFERNPTLDLAPPICHI